MNAVRGQRHTRSSLAGDYASEPARLRRDRRDPLRPRAALTGLLDHAAGGTHAAEAVGWSIAHVSVSCVFVSFCTWHIVLNRRALLRYLRAAGARAGSPRRLPARETVAAAAVVGGVLALTVIHALADG